MQRKTGVTFAKSGNDPLQIRSNSYGESENMYKEAAGNVPTVMRLNI